MFSLDLLSGLVLFVTVTLFTPGPNNIMLMTSGLNFGFRQTLPHLAGVCAGFAFMVAMVGFGVGAIFEFWPWLYSALKWAGAAYLVYLAYGIATSGPVEAGETAGRPMTFLQAAAFQWVNPKAWVMALGAVSTYAAVAVFPLNILAMVSLFGIIGIASSGSWVVFGQALRRLLADPTMVRWFNVAMAAALVASLYPIFADLAR